MKSLSATCIIALMVIGGLLISSSSVLADEQLMYLDCSIYCDQYYGSRLTGLCCKKGCLKAKRKIIDDKEQWKASCHAAVDQGSCPGKDGDAYRAGCNAFVNNYDSYKK